MKALYYYIPIFFYEVRLRFLKKIQRKLRYYILQTLHNKKMTPVEFKKLLHTIKKCKSYLFFVIELIFRKYAPLHERLPQKCHTKKYQQ